MNDAADQMLLPGQRERSAFFRRYYDPIASNSRHGLAVVDADAGTLIYANSRFLTSHQIAPDARFPLPWPERSGDAARAVAIDAAREGHEVRRHVPRDSGSGAAAAQAEIVAIPLGRTSDFGRSAEVVLIEKEEVAVVPGALEEERDFLAAVVRHSADAIIGLDNDGRIRAWNKGAVDTFGYAPEEAIGFDPDFLLPKDEAARREWAETRAEFEKKGILKNHPARRLAKDGRVVIVTITMSRVHDAAGNPRGTSMICRDVTMETLLRELIEHQLRATTVIHEIGDLMHSVQSVDEILRLILIGVTAGQGLGFNRAFLLLVEGADADLAHGHLKGALAIGPSNAEEADRIWKSLAREPLKLPQIHQRYVAESEAKDVLVNSIVAGIDVPLSREDHVFVKVLRGRQTLNVVKGRIIGGGEVDPEICKRLLSDTFAAVPLNTRERTIGVLVVDNLITGMPISDADVQMLKVFANHAGIALENSRLRAQLQRRLLELALANRSMQEYQTRLMQKERLAVIGEMAARVVHEVRNPLVSIGGFARLVRRGFNPDDPRSDYLRIISDEVARLERIVMELLDFSKPQNRLQLAPVDVNVLVHETLAMASIEGESQGDTHRVSIVERVDPALGPVTIDGDKIRQVLHNLVRNAIEAMPDSGELVVETAVIDADRFRITVADNGPGIPVDRRERVFEPGFTTRQEGTGFGLAIAKRMVELHGGTLQLRDVPRGCTFDIVLPRRVDLQVDQVEKSHDQPGKPA